MSELSDAVKGHQAHHWYTRIHQGTSRCIRAHHGTSGHIMAHQVASEMNQWYFKVPKDAYKVLRGISGISKVKTNVLQR